MDTTGLSDLPMHWQRIYIMNEYKESMEHVKPKKFLCLHTC